MSALGQKQTSRWLRVMSALPPKADITGRRLDVRRSARYSASGVGLAAGGSIPNVLAVIQVIEKLSALPPKDGVIGRWLVDS
jgi:hypothetical protein